MRAVTKLLPNKGKAVSVTPTPLSQDQRLELANRLYREYHTRCFWHCPRDLVITADLLPLVIKGLRKHGGRRGFILAGQLEPAKAGAGPAEKDCRECR